VTPKVKVCGVTDAVFATAAAQRGVDYLGVIFVARSPRCVTQAQTQKIAQAARTARPVKPPRIVGVFVEQTAREIAALATAVPLDVVQLHGAYDASDVAALKAKGLEVWRLYDGAAAGEDATLLDGQVGKRRGGTGQLADWSLVAELKQQGRRVVLAGGLSADNIAAAAATGADILDVNSSLETTPGVKSIERLDALLDEWNKDRP
jgi:indole-3-glycerol phosphate synthase/phosphoribosylanthranilate isomerase